ncbi:hypothetical protein EDB85DRAFT_153429 [Lactarius pseudohatsudake]|nr:hypothetical protein EDB85DRAFT_153429 [Lactarius pseudohatsudake]
MWRYGPPLARTRISGNSAFCARWNRRDPGRPVRLELTRSSGLRGPRKRSSPLPPPPPRIFLRGGLDDLPTWQHACPCRCHRGIRCVSATKVECCAINTISVGLLTVKLAQTLSTYLIRKRERMNDSAPCTIARPACVVDIVTFAKHRNNAAKAAARKQSEIEVLGWCSYVNFKR